MSVVIEKGVPVPVCMPSKKRWPAADMEVGDSFFVPPPAADDFKARRKVAGLAGNFNIQHKPKRFVSRAVDGGWRIWRVS